MISREAFFRRALLLPIIGPLLLGIGAILAPPVLGGIGVIIGGSLLYGGAAYAVFAAAMYWWTRGKPWPTVRRAALIAPVLFAPLCGLNMAAVFAFGAPAVTGGRDQQVLQYFLEGAGLGLVFGYGYVLLTFMLERARHPHASLDSEEAEASRSRKSAT